MFQHLLAHQVLESHNSIKLPLFFPSACASGETTNNVKQNRKRKTDSLTIEDVEKQFGKPIDQAASSIGVSRSTLKRFCREHGIPSWPSTKHSQKTVCNTKLKLSEKSRQKQNLRRPSNTQFGLFSAVFLIIRIRRWSCSIKRHGFSGKWWRCGRHGYAVFKSDYICQATRLLIQLLRWRKRTLMRNALRDGDHPAVSEITAKPKHMVTMKATYKDDMIKFQFPTSSGLSELKHEVSLRINSKSGRLRLKYVDEDNDLITLACDADLHSLPEFTNHSTIRFIVVADD